MKLTVKGAQYRFSFVQPQNSKMPTARPDSIVEAVPELLETVGETTHTLAEGRNAGRIWKSDLGEL
jgi:hypothetical protein